MKVRDIARLVGGEADGEPELEISGVSGIEDAAAGDISFVASKKILKIARDSEASCLLVDEFYPELKAVQIKVDSPHYSFAVLLEHFYGSPRPEAGIHEMAFVEEGADVSDKATVAAFAHVSKDATVGSGTVLYPGVYVGQGASIGKDCIIHPNAVIGQGVTLGDRVTVHPAAVIGSDGFGYVMHGRRHHKIPQVGTVKVGDDVEIGSCTTIDRATTGSTVIGSGTKIDNLVQIAHNVTIGENSIIVSQVGIAGSTKIGEQAVLGGQVGIADHINIADGTIIAARSGVMHDLKRGIYAGAPAVPRREFMRIISHFLKLHELNSKVNELEERLAKLEGRHEDD